MNDLNGNLLLALEANLDPNISFPIVFLIKTSPKHEFSENSMLEKLLKMRKV